MPSKPSFLFVILLAVALIGVTSADAAKKPKKPKQSSGFVVLDSSDPPKEVGKFFGSTKSSASGSTPKVAFDVNGQIVRIIPRGNGYAIDIVLFTTPDCSLPDGENALINVSNTGDVIPLALVNAPGNTLYVERPDSLGGYQALSALDLNGQCIPENTFFGNAIILDPVGDLDDHFIPPFTLVGDAPAFPPPAP